MVLGGAVVANKLRKRHVTRLTATITTGTTLTIDYQHMHDLVVGTAQRLASESS
jgi:hypothetical protein